MKHIVFLSTLLVLIACNKEKRFSNRLMKGETWVVDDIQVDGNSINVYGNWNITSDVDIYDSVPRVLWNHAGEDATFEWQFQQKGQKFRLSYYQLCEECEGASLDPLDYIAYGLTGTYDVKRHGRKKMKFSSKNTLDYSGKEVIISIRKK